MENLGVKFYSNDPQIGEVKDIKDADFAIQKRLLTMEEVKEYYPDLLLN